MKSQAFPRAARWTLGLLAITGTVACTDDGSSDDEVASATESDSTDTSTTSSETEVGESESTTASTTDESTIDESTTAESTTDESTTDESTTDESTTGDPDVCGDAMITGAEICDDGVNDGAYGGCNADCLSLAATVATRCSTDPRLATTPTSSSPTAASTTARSPRAAWTS